MNDERDLTHPTDELRSLLQAGDPLGDGCIPGPEQIAAARWKVLAAARLSPVPRRLAPTFLIPAAALLTLAAGLGVWRGLPSPAVLPQVRAAGQMEGSAQAPLDVRGPRGTRLLFFSGPPAPALQEEWKDRRLLHFQAPGGTRIFWTLSRDFKG
jgi:hypothetical protein